MAAIDLKIYPDLPSLNRAAGSLFASELEPTLRAHPRATFVLTGGATAKELYEFMGTSCNCRDWDRIEFFWGDERCVPPDDESSNFLLAQQGLLSRLAVPERRIHRIRGEVKDPEQAAHMYEQDIRATFQGSALPCFDLIHLGMGDDGHTASLFPGTSWDESRMAIVNYSPRHPFVRISMTLKLLNAARRVVFVVSGQSKALALKRIMEDPACDYPAKRVQPAAGRLTWLVDAAAASLLRSAR